MYLVETVLGNRRDPRWEIRLADAQVDVLELSQWDAQKNRLRKETRQGLPLAIALDRGAVLHDGDILWWEADTQRAVVCHIDLCEVMAIDLAPLTLLPPQRMAERVIALGHALGNQHWPAVVDRGRVLVPLSVSRDVMDAVMDAHRFDGLEWDFLAGADVAAQLEPALARRLFGGSERPMDGGEGRHRHGHHHHDHHDHPSGERATSDAAPFRKR